MAPSAPAIEVAIGEVRRRTGMTSRAIRFYEDVGLIRTERDRRGLRCYDQTALDRLLFIGQSRRAGLTVAQIADLLALADREGHARMLAQARDLYRARVVDLRKQLAAVEAGATALGVSLQPQPIALRA